MNTQSEPIDSTNGKPLASKHEIARILNELAEAGKVKVYSSESSLITELEQQIFSYFDLCAMYETTPSVLGFAQHLKESYQ